MGGCSSRSPPPAGTGESVRSSSQAVLKQADYSQRSEEPVEARLAELDARAMSWQKERSLFAEEVRELAAALTAMAPKIVGRPAPLDTVADAEDWSSRPKVSSSRGDDVLRASQRASVPEAAEMIEPRSPRMLAAMRTCSSVELRRNSSAMAVEELESFVSDEALAAEASTCGSASVPCGATRHAYTSPEGACAGHAAVCAMQWPVGLPGAAGADPGCGDEGLPLTIRSCTPPMPGAMPGPSPLRHSSPSKPAWQAVPDSPAGRGGGARTLSQVAAELSRCHQPYGAADAQEPGMSHAGRAPPLPTHRAQTDGHFPGGATVRDENAALRRSQRRSLEPADSCPRALPVA